MFVHCNIHSNAFGNYFCSFLLSVFCRLWFNLFLCTGSNNPDSNTTLVFGSLARRRNPTLAHRNIAHWRHVGPTFDLQPYANPIPPLSNVSQNYLQPCANLIPPVSNVGLTSAQAINYYMPTMFNQCLTSAQRPASTIYNNIPPVVHVGQTFNNLPCDTHQTVVWKKL